MVIVARRVVIVMSSRRLHSLGATVARPERGAPRVRRRLNVSSAGGVASTSWGSGTGGSDEIVSCLVTVGVFSVACAGAALGEMV